MEDKTQKISKVMEILKKEYPFEGLLLGVLGIAVLVLGVYIFEGEVLAIQLTHWWIFATSFRIGVFSVLVMLIGLTAILVSLAPFFVPGLKEMRRVTWPNRSLMSNQTARVFGFIILLSLMFILYDFIYQPIFEFLYDIGAY